MADGSFFHDRPLIDMTDRRSILESVARMHGLSAREVGSRSRKRRIVRVRQEAIWWMRQKTVADGSHRYSLPMIGRAFIGPDGKPLHHTTILHAIRAYERTIHSLDQANQEISTP